MSLDLSSDALCGISYVRFVCVCDGGVGLDRAGGKGRCSPRETELERASVECLSRSLDRETDRPMWKRAGWLAGWLHQEGGVDVSTCSRMIYLISHSIMNFWPIISRAPITHKELIMGRKLGWVNGLKLGPYRKFEWLDWIETRLEITGIISRLHTNHRENWDQIPQSSLAPHRKSDVACRKTRPN